MHTLSIRQRLRCGRQQKVCRSFRAAIFGEAYDSLINANYAAKDLISPLSDPSPNVRRPTFAFSLELMHKHDMIRATGHLGRREIVALVRTAKEIGLRKVVVTHAEFLSQSLSAAEQAELANMGALIDPCFTTMHTGKATWEDLMHSSRARLARHPSDSPSGPLIKAGATPRVITVASRTYFLATPGQMAYVASKGAVMGMMRVLPEHLAALIAFLASDDTEPITGQMILCDGGGYFH